MVDSIQTSLEQRGSVFSRLPVLLQKSRAVLYVLLILSVALAFTPYLNDSYSLVKIAALYFFTSAIVLTFWTQKIMAGSEISLRYNKRLLFASALFLFLTVLALVGSIDPWISFWGQYQNYSFGVLPFIFFLGLAWHVAQEEEGMHSIILSSVFVSAVIASLYGMAQYFGFEFAGFSARSFARVRGSFGNPVYLASYAMLAFFLGVELWLRCKEPQKKAVVFLGQIIVLVGLVLTFSRAAWIGLVAGIALFCCWSFLKKQHQKFSKQLLILGAILCGIAFTLPSVKSRALSLGHLPAPDQVRMEGYRAALNAFLENPILGSGPDTFIYTFRKWKTPRYVQFAGPRNTQAHAHSDILQYLATLGIMGTAAYLFFWGSLFVALWRREDSDSGIPLAFLTAAFVHNQFSFMSVASLSVVALFWGRVFTRLSDCSWKVPQGAQKTRQLYLLTGALVLLLLNLAVLRLVKSDFHFLRSQEELAIKNYPAAVKNLEYAIAGNRHVSSYYQQLVNIFGTLASMESDGTSRGFLLNNAEVAAKEAVQMIPSYPDAHNNLGVVYMWQTVLLGQNKKPQAKKNFEAAIARDPTFVDAWTNLAKVAHFDGDFALEKELWQKVLLFEPHNFSVQNLISSLDKKANGGQN